MSSSFMARPFRPGFANFNQPVMRGDKKPSSDSGALQPSFAKKHPTIAQIAFQKQQRQTNASFLASEADEEVPKSHIEKAKTTLPPAKPQSQPSQESEAPHERSRPSSDKMIRHLQYGTKPVGLSRKLPLSRIPQSDYVMEPSLTLVERDIVRQAGGTSEAGMWSNVSFPSKYPNTRKEVVLLDNWLQSKLNALRKTKETSQSSVVESIRDAQNVYSTCLHEIMRQVSTHCYERGMLLNNVWKSYDFLFEQLIRLCNDRGNMTKQEQQKRDTLNMKLKNFNIVYQLEKREWDLERNRLKAHVQHLEHQLQQRTSLRQMDSMRRMQLIAQVESEDPELQEYIREATPLDTDDTAKSATSTNKNPSIGMLHGFTAVTDVTTGLPNDQQRIEQARRLNTLEQHNDSLFQEFRSLQARNDEYDQAAKDIRILDRENSELEERSASLKDFLQKRSALLSDSVFSILRVENECLASRVVELEKQLEGQETTQRPTTDEETLINQDSSAVSEFTTEQLFKNLEDLERSMISESALFTDAQQCMSIAALLQLDRRYYENRLNESKLIFDILCSPDNEVFDLADGKQAQKFVAYLKTRNFALARRITAVEQKIALNIAKSEFKDEIRSKVLDNNDLLHRIVSLNDLFAFRQDVFDKALKWTLQTIPSTEVAAISQSSIKTPPDVIASFAGNFRPLLLTHLIGNHENLFQQESHVSWLLALISQFYFDKGIADLTIIEESPRLPRPSLAEFIFNAYIQQLSGREEAELGIIKMLSNVHVYKEHPRVFLFGRFCGLFNGYSQNFFDFFIRLLVLIQKYNHEEDSNEVYRFSSGRERISTKIARKVISELISDQPKRNQDLFNRAIASQIDTTDDVDVDLFLAILLEHYERLVNDDCVAIFSSLHSIEKQNAFQRSILVMDKVTDGESFVLPDFVFSFAYFRHVVSSLNNPVLDDELIVAFLELTAQGNLETVSKSHFISSCMPLCYWKIHK